MALEAPIFQVWPLVFAWRHLIRGLTAGAAQQSGSGCREMLSLGAATMAQCEMTLRRLNAYLAKSEGNMRPGEDVRFG